MSSVAWNMDRCHGSEFADSQSDALRYLDSASIHAFEMEISTAWMYIYDSKVHKVYIDFEKGIKCPWKRVSCIKIASTSSVDAPRGISAPSTALRGTCC